MPGLSTSFLKSHTSLSYCRSTLVHSCSSDLVKLDRETSSKLKEKWAAESTVETSSMRHKDTEYHSRDIVFMKKPSRNSCYCSISSFLLCFHSFIEPYMNEWCLFIVKNEHQIYTTEDRFQRAGKPNHTLIYLTWPTWSLSSIHMLLVTIINTQIYFSLC